MTKTRKLTLLRVAAHDFNRGLRAWQDHIDPKELIIRLSAERARATANILRSALLAIIGALWLAANKGELTVKLTLIDLKIPSAYVLLGVTFFLLATVVSLISHFVLNHFVLVASKTLFKFDSPWALTAPFDGGSAWSNGMLGQFRFFKSSAAHQRLGFASVFLLNLPLLVMLVFVYWTIVRVGATLLSGEGFLSTAAVLVFVSWLLVAYSIIQVVVMFVPFTFTKNTRFVRWNFLWPLYRKFGLMPPHVRNWFDKPKAS